MNGIMLGLTGLPGLFRSKQFVCCPECQTYQDKDLYGSKEWKNAEIGTVFDIDCDTCSHEFQVKKTKK